MKIPFLSAGDKAPAVVTERKPQKISGDKARTSFLSRILHYWEYGKPLSFDRDYWALLRAYRSWVYVCASKNATSMASVPLRLYITRTEAEVERGFTPYHPTRKVSSQRLKFLLQNKSIASLPCVRKAVEIEEVEDHPFLRLMTNINGFMNSHDFMEQTELYQELCGNAYWLIIPDQLGVPRELWPLPPASVKIVPHPQRFISHYEYSHGLDSHDYDERMVVHFKMPNSTSLYYGKSPLSAVSDSYNIGQQMDTYEQALFQNMGRLEGAFETDESIGENEFLRLKRELQQMFGGVRNVGKTPLLDKGVSFKQYSFAPREMAFLQGRKHVKEEICFVPGTPIFTPDGMRPIESVGVGDYVLSHEGRFRKVIKTYGRQYIGPMVGVKAKGFPTVHSTPNHPFLTATASSDSGSISVLEDIRWKQASDLGIRGRYPSGNYRYEDFDNVVFPRIKPGDLKQLDLANYCEGLDNVEVLDDTVRMMNYNARTVKRFIPVGDDLARLCGLFVAEGCANDRQILFYFNKDEIDYCEEVVQLLDKLFGIPAKVSGVSKYNTRMVRATSKPAAAFFKQFGHTAKNKSLPWWIFCANEQFWGVLIGALVDGDGHRYNNGVECLTTSSVGLAWQVRMLLLSLGMYATLDSRKNPGDKIRGKKINNGMFYMLRWRPELERVTSFRFQNGHMASFISGIKESNYLGKVYNLEVEVDNSYVTIAGAVHNCNAYGQSLALYDKDATRANADAAMYAFMRDAIRPRCIRMEQKINEKLMPWYEGDLFVAFDDCVPEDREYRLKEIESHLKTGYSSVNLERQEDGLREVDWGHVPILQSGMVPYNGTAPVAAPAGEIPPVEEEPEEGTFIAEQLGMLPEEVALFASAVAEKVRERVLQ